MSNVSSFSATLSRLISSTDCDWAEGNFKATLLALSQQLGLKRVLEIGGGRRPSFTVEEVAAAGLEYSISDISESELALADARYGKHCFDIGGASVPLDRGQYDLIFSCKVFEHVANAEQAYRNAAALLAPGGVLVNFVPVLFSPPMVINQLLPEKLAAAVLRFYRPERNPNEQPKFPSFYRLCRANAATAAQIKACGFDAVVIKEFYGHHYFDRVPVLKHTHAYFTRLCQRFSFKPLASRAYILARKASPPHNNG